MLSVLNGGGDGGSLLDLSSLRPGNVGGSGTAKCGGEVRPFARIPGTQTAPRGTL